MSLLLRLFIQTSSLLDIHSQQEPKAPSSATQKRTSNQGSSTTVASSSYGTKLTRTSSNPEELEALRDKRVYHCEVSKPRVLGVRRR